MPGVLLDKAQGGEAASPMEEDKKAPETKEKPKNEAPASRATVGIIYPPPEVRSIPPFIVYTCLFASYFLAGTHSVYSK